MSRRANDDVEAVLREWLNGAASAIGGAPEELRQRVDGISLTEPRDVSPWWGSGIVRRAGVVAATAAISAVLTLTGVGLASALFGMLPAARPTMADLEGAVESAIATIKEAPGIQGTQTAYIDEHLASAVWFDRRKNGDVVVVQRVDRDVAESGWWLGRDGEPPAVGQTVDTTIRILAGASFYEAALRSDEPTAGWSVAAESAAPPGLALGLIILGDGGVPLGSMLPVGASLDNGQVVREELADGGTRWTITTKRQDGEAIQTWEIGAGGELRRWSWHLVGVTPSIDAGALTSGHIEFRPVASPKPITAPDLSMDPSLARLEIPSDFPLSR